MSEKFSSRYLCLSSFLGPETFNFTPFKINIFDYFNLLNDLNSNSENICSICLKNCKKLSFPDSCKHQFCYYCLKQLKKYKEICPC